MRFVNLKKLAIFWVAVLLFTFLFTQSLKIDFRQHDSFTSNLLRIKELDALSDQNVVQLRAGLLTAYDSLANNFAELKLRHKRLANIPMFLPKTDRSTLETLVKTQIKLFQTKETFVERFKSENAVLKNSLYYFPTLINDLSQKDQRYSALLEELLRNILIYHLTPSAELAPQIQNQINLLAEIKIKKSSNLDDADLERAISHAQLVLNNKALVDTLVEQIFSLPTSQRSEALYKAYNQSYEKAVKTVEIYRVLLALFCIVLISGISAYIIFKLRRSGQIVSIAKEKLQAALAATQQAEAKFRKIFENSTDGIFQTTPEGKYFNANPTLARIFGYASPEDLMTKVSDIGQQLYVKPNRREEFIAAIASQDVISQFESEIYCQDGSTIWISENARAVKDADGVLLYYEGTVENITERKLAEAMLQASEMKLRLQQEALMQLSMCQPLYTGDLIAALQEITETAAYTLGVDRVGVWLYNQDQSKLCCVDLYELKLNQHSGDLDRCSIESPEYFQLLKTSSLIAADNGQVNAFTEAFSSSNLTVWGNTSMLNIPIRLGGETVGLLSHEQTGDSRKWSLEEQNFASYLAYMASLAMEARDRKQAQEALRLEREKTEQLLLNILPSAIAQRLKQQQGAIADSFEEVSVLFADIVGFTQIASRVSPTELVDLLNQIFSAFDQLAELHGLEKIKTIGDAYMVVAGLPTPRADHAQAIAQMALDMQDAIAKFNGIAGEALNIRIGINTGPVVAGVIGIKKFIYDLWGDTVNVASRMESQGIPGTIQVTTATYDLLQHQYLFEQRGIIQVKGKGEMTTYFLTNRKGQGVI